VSRQGRGGNYVQLSTVGPGGRPHCRTVVFRGFMPSTSLAAEVNEAEPAAEQTVMKMITDSRSAKVAEIACQPAGELVWWFPRTAEQYRIAGRLQLVSAAATGFLQEARRRTWEGLSPPAREQFFWNDPGVSYEGVPEVPPSGGGGQDGGGMPGGVPHTFLLLLLRPETVQYLRLEDNLVLRDEETAADDGGSATWKCRRVNP